MCPSKYHNFLPSIRVIIPVWRDSEALEKSLPCLLSVCQKEQILLSLGEPDPQTEALADQYGVPWTLASDKGRGRQMNEAAALSDADILIFLHADTILPDNAMHLVLKNVRSGCIGGAFSRRFIPSNRFLDMTCVLADWRGLCFGWFLGDQAIFIQGEGFRQLGGFQEWNAFEDLDFSRRMNELGKTCLIQPGVVSSARRFTNRGPVRQTAFDLHLTLNYLLRTGCTSKTKRAC